MSVDQVLRANAVENGPTHGLKVLYIEATSITLWVADTAAEWLTTSPSAVTPSQYLSRPADLLCTKPFLRPEHGPDRHNEPARSCTPVSQPDIE
jgi:hypothetical protein